MPARSKDKRWNSRFARFACRYGVERLAAHLGVSRDALYKWIGGETHMRPARAKEIVRLAKVRHIRISLDEIYRRFDEVRSRTSNLSTRRK